MKDVPSTERMVLCSKQWKMMTQKEKDMFQKRCEQVGMRTSALSLDLLLVANVGVFTEKEAVRRGPAEVPGGEITLDSS